MRRGVSRQSLVADGLVGVRYCGDISLSGSVELFSLVQSKCRICRKYRSLTLLRKGFGRLILAGGCRGVFLEKRLSANLPKCGRNEGRARAEDEKTEAKKH